MPVGTGKQLQLVRHAFHTEFFILNEQINSILKVNQQLHFDQVNQSENAPKIAVIIIHLHAFHPGGSTFDGTASVAPSSVQHCNYVSHTNVKK
jgi:hypothetical protein